MQKLAIKVAKTFVQGFAAAIVVAGPAWATLVTLNNLKTGLAAGVFALLMNAQDLKKTV